MLQHLVHSRKACSADILHHYGTQLAFVHQRHVGMADIVHFAGQSNVASSAAQVSCAASFGQRASLSLCSSVRLHACFASGFDPQPYSLRLLYSLACCHLIAFTCHECDFNASPLLKSEAVEEEQLEGTISKIRWKLIRSSVHMDSSLRWPSFSCCD